MVPASAQLATAPIPETTTPIVAAKRHPAAQLALPFAAVGLVGGGLTGSITHQDEITIAFALVTAITAGVLGAHLTHRKRVDGHLTITRLVFGTIIAGTINGALLLLPAVFPVGSLAGALVGSLFAIPFLPVLTLVARWGDAVGSARGGSIVDHAHRRGPVAGAATMIAFSTLVVFIGGWGPTGLLLMRGCAGLALGVLGLVVGLDLFARAVARRAARQQTTATAPMNLELGVGDDVLVEGDAIGAPYRSPTAMVRLCGGDPATAYERLRAPLLRHSLALIVGVLAVLGHALR